MYEVIRFFWNAAAVAAAIVVGIFTHDAGLVAVTLIGGFFVPRMLGLVPRRGFVGWARRSCGRWPHRESPVPPARPTSAI
jgi:hypothetical protein